MKILVVTTNIPYPLNEGANIRIYNLVKQLSNKHAVTLATLLNSYDEIEYIQEMDKICEKVVYVIKKRSAYRRFSQIILTPFMTTPYIVKINESNIFQHSINQLSLSMDIAQAEFPYGAQYIKYLKCKKILDAHNVESDILKNQYIFEDNILKKVFFYLQHSKMLKYETKICSQMDGVLATSEDDRKVLMEYNNNTIVIPNGVADISNQVDQNNKIITFVGLMSYRANIDAMLYFTNTILPLIVAREPEVKLFIVGKKPAKEISNLAGSNVVVTGEVEDINKYIRESSVMIVPLRIGSGTRIKILEAMSHGKPVVSTSLGCMGIAVKNGENIFIADEPEIFAKHVVNLLGNKNERTRIGSNGLELVKNCYTWKKIAMKLEEVYKSEN